MLCLKKRRTYSFTQGACAALPRRSKKDNNHYEGSLNMAITTLPRNNRSREEKSSRMVLTVTENTPADMLAGSMELLVQLPHDHYLRTQRVTVLRSTPMMDLLVQIATAHKLTASNYTLQAIGEHGLVLSHHPNTPIGALDALQVKLLSKQGMCVPRKVKQANQPFETTFRLQVHLPRNQLYVSRVSPKMNLGEILDEVCREKNLDSSKYELRHPATLEETLDLSLSLQDYQLQEVTLYAKQRSLGQTLSTQDILALQRQEERRRQQSKQSVFGFAFKKSKESSLSMDSLGGRSVSPARSDETTRSASPLQPPTRPQRKRRPAPKPPADIASTVRDASGNIGGKDKMVINHSRNSSDSSGYHEASVLSDNPDSTARLPETLPRRSRMPGMSDTARRLAQTSQSSKSLGNLAVPGETLNRGISSTCLSSTGLRKKRAAPPPPASRPLSSAISTQALERIVDSEESLTSDIDPSKPPSDIGAPSKASSDIDCSKINSDISAQSTGLLSHKPKPETVMCESDSNIQQNCAIEMNVEARSKSNPVDCKLAKVDAEKIAPVEVALKVEQARVAAKRVGELAPLPRPRKINVGKVNVIEPPKAPKRKTPLLLMPSRILNIDCATNGLSHEHVNSKQISEAHCYTLNAENAISSNENNLVAHIKKEEMHSKLRNYPTSPNKDQISQCDEISKIIGDTIKQISLKSSQNHEIRSNLELHFNSVEPSPVNAEEEVHFESKDKITSEDKFNQKERISDIINDVDNHESSSLNEHLSNEGDTKPHSVLTELDVLSTKLSLLESDVILEKREDNILEQDNEIKSKNIDFHDKKKNWRDNLFMSSDDDSLNENIIKQNRVTEPKSQQSKAHYRFINQESRAREMISFCEIEENVEAAKYVHLKDAMSSLERDRETCTVISTIPKCEHLDIIKENSASNNAVKGSVTKNIVELCEKRQNDQSEESNNNAKYVKRAKVVRSQSKSDDFEMDSLKRQRRYLTLPTEDIAYALNLNLSTRNSDTAENKRKQIAAGYCTNCTRDMDIAANQDNPSEIENLLQKVSNTLSNVLPISSSPVSEPSLPLKMNHTTASVQTNNAVVLDDSVTKLVLVGMKSNELCMDFPMGNTLNASMPNVTGMDSQQDTLDNVSAMNDNLSISDWEYQLPAPPSAFRDSISLVSDDYDTVMLGSVQDFKKLPANTVSDQVDARDNSDMNIESMKNLLNNIDENFDQKISSGKMSSVSEVEIDIKRIESEPVVKQTSAVSHKSANLRKEIISELENKLETGALVQTISKDFDRRNIDSLSAPQIAPVDNTLSNFTITTYTKPTKLDIFEEFKNPNDYATNSEKRFIKTFATLSRNKTSAPNNCDKKTTSKFEKSDANNIDCKTEPKIHSQDEPSHRWRSLIAANEKNNIQRSKSYISTFSNAKNQMEVQEIGEKKHEPRIESETTNVKKATSITDLNVNVRTSKDKFSQWRDNALKYQEEPTKEKQLQSLQVLKSILPQLKNAQQAEKNVSKEDKNTLSIKKIRYETGSNEHSMKTNVVSTRGSREFEPECKQLSKKEDTKRYVYTGPPAISLGSWSERPSVNVQIKMDIDYKLGKSNTNSNKTVNINMKNKKDATNFTDNICKNIIDQHETKNDFSTNKNPEELTRKLIAHTTASGFKIPLSSRINVSDSKTNEGNPIVMGMELKKTFIEMPKEMPRNNENEVDTTPLNFKELTKACSQHASFKQNPKCDNINKHSADYCSAQMKKIEEITDSNVKQYNDIKLPQASNQSDFSFKNQLSLHDIVQSSRAKKFTSIVGINGTSQNLELQSEMSLRGNANNTLKINPPMPVVKGFKISTTNYNTTNNRENHNGLSSIDSFNNDPQLPKPPTMPVITGVTLKSATVRLKSMPIQLDSRNMLLESIRNFGGREKLKSAAERY
ncbi:uro-adherence factor A isoform X3 [Linepithema humile]|uniref:uro-adherence factor A isoform X3 n=1 Tax=Linepithema humile TaxID=83485 RepID=UPI00351DB3A0